MNLINGFTKKDDDLPQRFFNENTLRSNSINRKEFLKVLDKYYKLIK